MKMKTGLRIIKKAGAQCPERGIDRYISAPDSIGAQESTYQKEEQVDTLINLMARARAAFVNTVQKKVRE
jgi:hypothetical protein